MCAKKVDDIRGLSISEFIRESLSEICEGISQAKKKTGGEDKSPIAPTLVDHPALDKQKNLVHFDISVCVERTKNGSGGFSISVPIVGGLQGNIGQDNATKVTQRIQFDVPFTPGSCK